MRRASPDTVPPTSRRTVRAEVRPSSRSRAAAMHRRNPTLAQNLIPVPAALPPTERAAERVQGLAELHAAMQACQRCVAAGHLARADAVAGYRGRIGDRLLIVGQAPGHLSVARGRPFSGPGGRVLDGWLRRAGFAPGALHREAYICALTRCDPGKNQRGGGDRKPSPAEVALCRPYLLAELELVRPRAILLVGGMAIAAFLGAARLEDIIGGYVERNGVYLLPLPHPSGVSRWLNDAAHQALLGCALCHLSRWREEWVREERGPVRATAADAADAADAGAGQPDLDWSREYTRVPMDGANG